MAKVKLSDYCKNNGISYVTGYRWFKEGKFPGKIEQTDTGTILVEENDLNNSEENHIMSMFLKKIIEFSKNNSTIEDFAAFILSNFSLKLKNTHKIKPKPEEIQKHFQKFLKSKEEKPKVNNMLLVEPDEFDKLITQSESDVLKEDQQADIDNEELSLNLLNMINDSSKDIFIPKSNINEANDERDKTVDVICNYFKPTQKEINYSESLEVGKIIIDNY